MSEEYNKKDNHFDWLKDEDTDQTMTGPVNDSQTTRDRTEDFKEKNDAKFEDTQGLDTEEVRRQQKLYEEKTKIDDNVKNYINQEIKKQKRPSFLRGLALVVAGSLIGTMVGLKLPREKQLVSNGPEASPVSIEANEEYNIENAVAKKAIPSVVGIQVNVKRQIGFWDDQVIQGQAIGSGVIVSDKGFILTNAHVVADASKDEGANILFSDNSSAVAKVLFVDETLDLAILKVDKEGLNAVELGDSDLVSVGDKAIAIGNPVGLNLQSTLTSGIISGTNRSIQMQDSSVMDGLFQTDAAINSGNSGGALLNKNGQLIGINTAKVQSTDNIGFAIPINVAKPIIESYIEYGSFEAVQLGIRGINLDIYQQYAADDNFVDKQGVVVMDVPLGGNASRAGLQKKDLIISIDDKPVESMNKLKQVLLTFKSGEKAQVKILRNGVEETIEVEFQAKAPNI